VDICEAGRFERLERHRCSALAMAALLAEEHATATHDFEAAEPLLELAQLFLAEVREGFHRVLHRAVKAHQTDPAKC